MSMAAILVMWPETIEQTFVPRSQGGSMWNLAHTYTPTHTPTHTHTHTHTRTTEVYLYYKLTNEPKGSGELNGFLSWKNTLAFTLWKNIIAFCWQKIKKKLARGKNPGPAPENQMVGP